MHRECYSTEKIGSQVTKVQAHTRSTVRVSTCLAFAHSQRALSITVNRTMFAQVVRAEHWIAKAYANKALELA